MVSIREDFGFGAVQKSVLNSISFGGVDIENPSFLGSWLTAQVMALKQLEAQSPTPIYDTSPQPFWSQACRQGYWCDETHLVAVE